MPKATYACKYCSKTFKTQGALNAHHRHHEFQSTSSLVPHGKVWHLNGYQSAKITKRPRRSFNKQRTAQVLRHLSTQLWAYCKDQHKTTMVEVEAMSAGGNLFIGANHAKSSRLIYSVLSCGEQTAAVLRYTKGGKGKLAILTKRFAKKLERLDRIAFEDLRSSYYDAKYTLDVLLTAQPRLLNTSDKDACKRAFASFGELYVVYASKPGNCNHVEEKFMNLLANAAHKDGAIVAGKMRPCGTCWGRMRWMNTLGFDVEHGQHPGFLWLERLNEQPPQISKFTLQEYTKVGSHTSSFGGSGYASDSDSEGDDDL